ncbi:MAG TPA: hypothetical protein VKD22_12705 [Ramlibacter sp.]|nr:hypothetical protein [Ramlibacter sp.]
MMPWVLASIALLAFCGGVGVTFFLAMRGRRPTCEDITTAAEDIEAGLRPPRSPPAPPPTTHAGTQARSVFRGFPCSSPPVSSAPTARGRPRARVSDDSTVVGARAGSRRRGVQ